MSILKLAKIINTRESAARKFEEEAWKRGFGCVKCGSIRAWKHRKLKNGLQKYRCEDCKHLFSDQSWTVLRWNKARIDKVAIVNHLSGKKLDVRSIARESELNKNTVMKLATKIRRLKSELYEAMAPPQLGGIVKMDETKMGKDWYWGAIERGTNNAIVEKIPGRSEAVLSARIWKYIEEGSTIMTDELASYQPHPRFYKHFAVKHCEYFVHPECNLIHTNRIEGLWAQLKRKIERFCNNVKPEHIQEYINEYFYLKNHEKSKNPTFFPLYCRKT